MAGVAGCPGPPRRRSWPAKRSSSLQSLPSEVHGKLSSAAACRRSGSRQSVFVENHRAQPCDIPDWVSCLQQMRVDVRRVIHACESARRSNTAMLQAKHMPQVVRMATLHPCLLLPTEELQDAKMHEEAVGNSGQRRTRSKGPCDERPTAPVAEGLQESKLPAKPSPRCTRFSCPQTGIRRRDDPRQPVKDFKPLRPSPPPPATFGASSRHSSATQHPKGTAELMQSLRQRFEPRRFGRGGS
mmetsp:Transcript_28899/g.54199  ORF Transcript_28899/g.54199 Transcript_28899/m.54199 type:complete len:242 (+) Transcript_28899:73-798(+)